MRPAVAIVVGIFLAGLTVALGCVPLQSASKTMTMSAPYVAGDGVVVLGRNGAVELLVDATQTRVMVTADVKCSGATLAEAEDRLAGATVTLERSAERGLVIEPIFPGGARSGDAASLSIIVPQAASAQIDTSNGAVTARGLSGPLTIRTGNGAISVAEHAGAATLNTSNGAIEVDGLGGPLKAVTSNGRVRAADIAGPVEVKTSNGRVEVALRPDQQGPVNLRSSNGRITVNVGPAFAGPVTVDTSNGGVNIEDPTGRITSSSIKKNEGTFHVGGEGPESFVKTSNGRIIFAIASP